MIKKQIKRGLVLEGGGAKGAYALGCLLAFKSKGINFDVISGTSVGALNAAIASAEKIESGKELWQRLSFSKVCKPTRFLSTWLFLPVHILSLFLHHVPFIGSLPFSNKLDPKSGYTNIATFVGVPIVGNLLISICFVWLFDDLSDFIIFNFFTTAPLAVLGLIWAVPFWIRQNNIAIFSVAPLRNEIARIIEHAEYKVPTYITVAFRKMMFDPDKPGFYVIGGQGYFLRQAMSHEEYLPLYVRLDSLQYELQTDFLTASAAIPFGIFPSVHLKGIECIDGGVIDNTPIFPLLQNYDCDEIYVIRLRPNRTGEIKETWQRVDRIIRIAEMDIEECKALYYGKHKKSKTIHHSINPPENVPFREFPLSTERLIIISPKKSLGSFLRGTMNFTCSYTNKLLKMGFEDTLNTLNQVTDG